MIIALPEKDHSHLADALVRDLGFTRTHVDAPLRELLLALDPFVDSGVTLANMGPSPRLSSKLEQVGGRTDEERWDRLLHPPRPGSAPDRTATEVKRLLDVLRDVYLGGVEGDAYGQGDVAIVGVTHVDQAPYESFLVAIEGRHEGLGVSHWISPAGVVGEQEAIVAYVKELREPTRLHRAMREAFAEMVKGDNEYIDPPDPNIEIAFAERETAAD